MFPAPTRPAFTTVTEATVVDILGGHHGYSLYPAVCGLLLSATESARCAVQDGADPAATLSTLLAEVETIARVKNRLQLAAGAGMGIAA